MESYLYVLAFAVLNCFIPQKYQKFSSTCLWILMMLMCGFRAYDVGADTHNYIRYQQTTFVSDYSWGPVYIILKQIAALFPIEETAFLLIMAILTYMPLIYLTRNVSVFPGITLLMYIIPCGIFFNESFNIARQSIAIVYTLLAAVAIENKRMRLSYILFFIAFMFHPYTIFFVFFYLLKNVRFTKRLVFVAMLISMLVGFAGNLGTIQIVLSMMTNMFSGSSNELLSKLAKYGNGYNIASNFSIVGQLSHMLPMVVLCVVGHNRQTENNTYYKMMVCGCIITNLLVSVIYCERFASSFTIAQLLAVPYIYKTSNMRKRVLFIMILILTTLLYIYNLSEYSNLDTWTTYHTIFN